MNVRECVLKSLYEIEYNGAYSNAEIKKALSVQDFSKQDKAFFTALVYGTVDKKLTLDYYIKSFSKIKLKKISKFILLILRMGIYQLIFMDKVPQSAAVNESVKLARRYGHGASAGFVNGILRSISKGDVEYPTDKYEYLSVKYSFPENICRKWIDEFGFEFTEQLMLAFEENKKITLRANSLKTTPEELAEKLCASGVKAEVKNGAVETDGFAIDRDELYIGGYYTPQDIAAMQTALILEPESGEMVMDMCAAPGGKTTHIAELMNNTGKIVAFDKYEHKITLINKNAERLGINIIEASASDAEKFNAEYVNTADRILCDVPCSGLGIIGRKPDIKWNRDETADITYIQKKILNNAAKYLKENGILVYSTCTIEKEENSDVTGAFLAENKNFEKIYEKTFYPHLDGTDGFYICKIRKNRMEQ